MTKSQRAIVTFLAITALLVLVGLGCASTFLFASIPDTVSIPEGTIVVEQNVAAATPSPVTGSTPTATPVPSETAQPTPTGTRVVTVTVPPTPSPTRANCIDHVTDFQASQLLTNEEIQQYLRQTIPLSHLDHCRSIRYVHKLAAVHGTEISGNFIPIYREIEVYLTHPVLQRRGDLLDTLVHEIGHNVHFNIRREQFELDTRWSQLHKQSQKTFDQSGFGFVSDYARVNKFEDFAESYRAFVRDPETLKYYNNDKYEFMRVNVFGGRDFAER